MNDALPDQEFVQQAVARLPWGHNVVLLDKLPGPEARRGYAALSDKTQPMGVAEFKLLEPLPPELQTSLPSIEQIERELAGPEGRDEEKETV